MADPMDVINEHVQLNCSALGANAEIHLDGPTIQQDFRILKAQIVAAVSVTTSERAWYTLHHAPGGFTDAEIAEAINAVPVGRHDRSDVEEAQRPVWMIGAAIPEVGFADGDVVFPFRGPSARQGGGADSVFMTLPFKWTYISDDEIAWNWSVKNNGPAAAPGSCLVDIHTRMFERWLS